MNNFNFWQKWLFGSGLYLCVFGIILAFFSHSPVMDFLFNDQIDPLFWENNELPGGADKFQGWIYGVLGSVLSGWGVFIAFIAHYPFKAKEKWAWKCLALAIIIWFLPDTVISVYYKVWFSVIFNIVLFLLLMLPLVFTRKQIFQNKLI